MCQLRPPCDLAARLVHLCSCAIQPDTHILKILSTGLPADEEVVRPIDAPASPPAHGGDEEPQHVSPGQAEQPDDGGDEKKSGRKRAPIVWEPAPKT